MKRIRKSLLLILLTALVLSVFTAGTSAAVPAVSAGAAVVLDGDTGAYYYIKDPDSRRAPASMTKLMTAYVIFEDLDSGKISANSVVTISAHGSAVAYTGGFSNVPLNTGEQYTVDTMLRLMLLPSACGACSSMADYISGSESAFVARMNQTAAALGMDAHFQNSHGAGVSPSGHYITARSMAILGAAFIKNHPGILNYTSLQKVSFKGNTYTNTNHYIGGSDYYAGVDGMKTGTNGDAGSCITVSAKQNGRRIIVVVMHSGDRYSDARKLLDYGFECVRQNDKLANNASVSLKSSRPDIRVGADFTVTAQVYGVSSPFVASGCWTVNGKEAGSFTGTTMGAGYNPQKAFNLDSCQGQPVTIGFCIKLPNGSVKKTEKTYNFSGEDPCCFRDMDGSWAETPVSGLKTTGAITGYTDGTFRPAVTISRAEFTAILVRALAADGVLTITGEPSGFADSAGTWADKYVAAGRKAGIVAGVSATEFAPLREITRQEIVSLLARAYQLEPAGTNLPFKDASSVAGWAKDDVIAGYEKGIIHGYTDGTIRPAASARRDEAAQLLWCCCNITE